MILLETTASIMMRMMVTLTIIIIEALYFTMMISTSTDSTFIKFVIYNLQFGASFWFHISSMILLLCLN